MLRKFAPGIFWFAALAVVLLVLLHESLFMGKGLVAAGAILQWPPWNHEIHPANSLLSDQYLTFLPTQEFVHQQKSLPLWDPNLCCGVPNLGSIQGALLSPIRLLFSPLNPFSANGPSAFLKLCLAGWFTMFYVRLIGVSRAAALLAGIIFSLSGFMIVWLGHPQVNSAIWLPLLLYFAEKSFKDGHANAFAPPALRAWAGFAVAFAFMILGGHPPTVIHISIVLFVYFIFRCMANRDGQEFRRLTLLIASVTLGLFLAAPQILPFLEYYRQSSAAESSALTARWSSHLTFTSLIHFLLPNVLGNPARGFEDLPKLLGWHEVDNFNERTGYVGIVPLFMATSAILLRRCKFTKFFFSLAIGSMLVIYGVWPLPIVLRALPILRDVNQARLLLIVGFSMAILAALGWDEFFDRMRASRRTLTATIGFCIPVSIAILCFWIITGPKIHTLDSAQRDFFDGQLLILAAGMAVVFLLALWPSHWKAEIIMVVCLAWTAADLLCFGMGYNPALPRNLYYPRTPAIDWLGRDHSLFRVFGEGAALPANSAEVFGLSDARGCDFMTVRHYEELIKGTAGEFFFYRSPSVLPKTLPLLNVKYLLFTHVVPLDPALYELVYSKEVFIYRDKECLDRAILVFNYQVEPNQATALAKVSSPEFKPREVLLLDQEPPSAKSLIARQDGETTAASSVRILSYEPDAITMDASLPRPGFLLLLDTYFPGWTATVNGKPAPVLRADYNFRAISLPAGKSSVSFTYRPASFRLGLWLCGLGILAVVALCFLPWKKKHRVSMVND